MSTTEITCPTCATTLQLPPDATASRFRCLQCSSVFDVPAIPVVVPVPAPAPFALPDPDDEDEAPRPARSRKKRDEDDAREERRSAYTRRPARREPLPKSHIALAILAGTLVLVGLGVGAFYAVREKPKEAVKNEPTPKPVPKVEPPKRESLTPEQMIRKVKGSTVYIRTHLKGGYVGSGSGFFAGKAGYVLTNAHVVGYGPLEIRVPERVEVVVDSGADTERTFPAKVFGVDAIHDLAVLQIDGRALPAPLAFGKAEELIETQEVVAFGYPFGERLGKNVSVNRTTVSSLRKSGGFVDVVQLAGGLNPGNSGGPVTNAKGEVIGVSVAKLRGTETIAFAIPAETADRFVDDQIACGGQIRLGGFAGEKPDEAPPKGPK